jgi:two-component sensor histidine kinase
MRESAEKSVLIEEVHHRVKNNLAVLASIINLQRDRETGEDAARALEQLHDRVNSMALVYQQLLGASDFKRLPFNEYVRSMLAYHQSARPGSGVAMERIERLDAIEVELGVAVPLGLVVNELIANAYAHGITAARDPVIVATLSSEGDAPAFSISDNGDGMAADYAAGTGLLIVEALCSQLRATLDIRSPSGPEGGTVRLPSAAAERSP